MNIEAIARLAPVIPVLTIPNADEAVPLASALARGGLRVLEVTLRTEAAADAIRAIRAALPDVIVGAGTVLNEDDLLKSCDAGARFVVSPGSIAQLLQIARQMKIPLLPGVATASEIMQGLAHGYTMFKFFPAENVGGVAALKALAAPFANVKFCPTGGITLQSAKDYLALPNVLCVGGSWVAPTALIEQRDWRVIEELALETTNVLSIKR